MREAHRNPKAPWWRHPAVRIGGSGILLAAIFLVLPADQVVAAIGRLHPAMWVLALAAYLMLHLIGVVKWRLLVNTTGAGLSGLNAVRAYYMGLFGNTFLPSIVGGDVVRAGVAFGVVRSRSGLLLGSVVDRVQDVVSLGLVAGVGVLLSPRALPADSRRVFVLLAVILAAAFVAALIAWRVVPSGRLSWRLRRKLVPVRRAVRATAARPSRLVTALCLGVLLQSLFVVLNWAIGRGIGIDIPLYVWFFVSPLAKLSGLLPVTQGGIGVREAAQAALFAPFGVSAVNAVAAGLAFQVVIISGGLVAGGLAMAMGSRAARLVEPVPRTGAPTT